ncbi:MAG TPA: replication-relaxation family protein [Anaerolineaceae bacterium]|nr:replication-relaxation family protein [Anaerolineaceae bacterium]
MTAGEVQLLESLARFPGLTASGYRVLDPREKSRRAFPHRLSRLCAESLVITGPVGGPEQFYLGEKGLVFLAAVYGMEQKGLNWYLGWPVRARQFRQEAKHNGIALEFMLRLAREKVLAAWDLAATRQEFHQVSSSSTIKGLRLVIFPDSVGALVTGTSRVMLFWLEVDRGTRSGKSLDWKLEKYFLAYRARVASAPVPVILYLVDTGKLLDEGRLRSVGRILQGKAGMYPGSPLVVLLTTRDLVAGVASRPLVEARIWRIFRGGRLEAGLLSLAEAYGGGA